tara:strand:- start:306 stop:557 length:252 start_codon:yes stop_codon:yes gene_type:complete
MLRLHRRIRTVSVRVTSSAALEYSTEIDLGLSFEETLEVLFLEDNLAGILDVGIRFPKAVVVTEVAVIAANAEELLGVSGIAR